MISAPFVGINLSQKCGSNSPKIRESKLATERGKAYLIVPVQDLGLFDHPKLFGGTFRTEVRLAPSTEQKSEVSKFSNSTENELGWEKQEKRISTSSGILRVEPVVKCR